MMKYLLLHIIQVKVVLLILQEQLRQNLQNFAKTHVPMKRYGKDGELNAGAIFLASDEASYVTGVILPIDGGYTCV